MFETLNKKRISENLKPLSLDVPNYDTITNKIKHEDEQNQFFRRRSNISNNF